jgi:hypothetical protein
MDMARIRVTLLSSDEFWPRAVRPRFAADVQVVLLLRPPNLTRSRRPDVFEDRLGTPAT